MFWKLLVAFTLIPVVELFVIIKVGGAIGALNTIAVVIATAAAGAYLARTQGLQAMLRVRARLNAGEVPTDDLIDALIIFMAGVVLLTPGFITDIFGILLLVPVTRAVFQRWLQGQFLAWSRSREIHIRRFP